MVFVQCYRPMPTGRSRSLSFACLATARASSQDLTTGSPVWVPLSQSSSEASTVSCWVARQRHVEYPTAGERFGDQLTEFEQHHCVVFQTSHRGRSRSSVAHHPDRLATAASRSPAPSRRSHRRCPRPRLTVLWPPALRFRAGVIDVPNLRLDADSMYCDGISSAFAYPATTRGDSWTISKELRQLVCIEEKPCPATSSVGGRT